MLDGLGRLVIGCAAAALIAFAGAAFAQDMNGGMGGGMGSSQMGGMSGSHMHEEMNGMGGMGAMGGRHGAAAQPAPRASASQAGAAGAAGKVAVTAEARAKAADIFESRCSTCHGPEGRGDGPAAENMSPRPMNFHNGKWQRSVDDATLARAIVYGGSAVGVSGEMAANPDLEDEPAVVGALIEKVRGWGK